MSPRPFNEWDAVKVLATLLVVAGHVARMFTPLATLPPVVGSRVVGVLASYIYGFHMPLFVAVSGAVYCYVKRGCGGYTDRRAFIRRKALRLLVPYFAFSLPLTATLSVVGAVDGPLVGWYARHFLLFGEVRHLWYLVALFLLLVLFDRVERRVWRGWTVPVACVAAHFVAYWLPLEFQLRATAYYALYFYLGYQFQLRRSEWTPRLARPASVLALGVAYVALHAALDHCWAWPWLMRAGDPVQAVCGSLAAYAFCAWLLRRRWLPAPWAVALGRDGLGIYLFHPMVIFLIFYACRGVAVPWQLLAPGTFVVALALSVLLTRGLRACGLKVLLGE